jgi:rhodanese-related sulfurtransferase
MAMLDARGIAVSAGSACGAKKAKASQALLAIGRSEKESRQSLRISLGIHTQTWHTRYLVHTLDRYFKGRIQHVSLLSPEKLDGRILYDEDTYILDVRPSFVRRKMPSLPRTHESSFLGLSRILDQIPPERHIIVTCQQGNLSYVAAYYLKEKGFPRVSSLEGGVSGWKERHEELYAEFAGHRVSVIQPA